MKSQNIIYIIFYGSLTSSIVTKGKFTTLDKTKGRAAMCEAKLTLKKTYQASCEMDIYLKFSTYNYHNRRKINFSPMLDEDFRIVVRPL